MTYQPMFTDEKRQATLKFIPQNWQLVEDRYTTVVYQLPNGNFANVDILSSVKSGNDIQIFEQTAPEWYGKKISRTYCSTHPQWAQVTQEIFNGY